MGKNRIGIALPPGIWQTIWFGSLKPSPLASSSYDIYTFFRLISGSSDLPVGTIRHELVSLAHMHILPIGQRIDGKSGELLGYKTKSSGFKRTLTVDFSRENTSIVSRSAIEWLGPAPDWNRQPEYDGLLILAKGTEATPQVLIPCASLFQFYWGTTSTLVDAVLKGELFDLERFFYNPIYTELQNDGLYRLEIRSQWLDVEVPYLAILLADIDAIKSGQQILTTLIDSRLHGQLLQLEVTPPFPSVTQIEGIFHAAPNGQLYVTQILSAELKPKWKSLLFTRENDNYKNDSDENSGGTNVNSHPLTEPITLAGRLKNKEISIEESPSGYSSSGANLPLLANLLTRFPILKELPSQRVKKTQSSQRNQRVRIRRIDGPWSAIRGSNAMDTRVMQGKLVGETTSTSQTPVPEQVELGGVGVDSQLLKYAESFISDTPQSAQTGRFVSVETHFLDPYQSTTPTLKPQFFSLPREIDDEKITWLYSDPNCMTPKRAFCVQLTCIDQAGDEHIRYVVDFERRLPRRRVNFESKEPLKTGFLIIWFERNIAGSALHESLCRVIAAVAKNRNPSIVGYRLKGVFTRSMRHVELEMGRHLTRIFDATDQCKVDWYSHKHKEPSM